MLDSDNNSGNNSGDDHEPHKNVRDWHVHTEDTEGNYNAVLGKTTIRSTNGGHLAEVHVFTSPTDGALVVQIDTSTQHAVPVRVNINDSPIPVFDETVTP